MSMAFLLTELEVLTIMFSILVFALFTLIGMINEECPHVEGEAAEEKPHRTHVESLNEVSWF